MVQMMYNFMCDKKPFNNASIGETNINHISVQVFTFLYYMF